MQPHEHDVHADFKRLEDGRRFLGCEDDASRRWRSSAYSRMQRRPARRRSWMQRSRRMAGRPPSCPATGCSSTPGSETRRRGRTEFERRLEGLQIRHAPARAGHPQTNGKIERFYEIERHLAGFEAESAAVPARCGPDGAAAHVRRMRRGCAPPSSTLRPRRGRRPCQGPLLPGRPQGRHGELVEQCNGDRPRMSLDEGETPAEALVRKIPGGQRQ